MRHVLQTVLAEAGGPGELRVPRVSTVVSMLRHEERSCKTSFAAISGEREDS